MTIFDKFSQKIELYFDVGFGGGGAGYTVPGYSSGGITTLSSVQASFNLICCSANITLIQQIYLLGPFRRRWAISSTSLPGNGCCHCWRRWWWL